MFAQRAPVVAPAVLGGRILEVQHLRGGQGATRKQRALYLGLIVPQHAHQGERFVVPDQQLVESDQPPRADECDRHARQQHPAARSRRTRNPGEQRKNPLAQHHLMVWAG